MTRRSRRWIEEHRQESTDDALFLLDTNVVLRRAAGRPPFVDEAGSSGRRPTGLFDACIASFTIPTIYYVCRKQDGAEPRHARWISASSVRGALYRECVLAARRMPGGDFEDNFQVACGITDFMQGIVTRNPRDFAASPIRVYTPGKCCPSC